MTACRIAVDFLPAGVAAVFGIITFRCEQSSAFHADGILPSLPAVFAALQLEHFLTAGRIAAELLGSYGRVEWLSAASAVEQPDACRNAKCLGFFILPF